jgi:hypothetical protein
MKECSTWSRTMQTIPLSKLVHNPFAAAAAEGRQSRMQQARRDGNVALYRQLARDEANDQRALRLAAVPPVALRSWCPMPRRPLQFSAHHNNAEGEDSDAAR